MLGPPSGRGGDSQGRGSAPPPSLCLSCHLLAVSLKGAEGLQGHTTMLRSGRHQGVQLTPGAPSQRQCLWPWCLWPALRTKERTRTGVLSAAWRLFLRPHLKCTALGKQIPPRPRSWLHSPDGKDTPALGTRKGEGGHGKSRGGSRNGRGRGLVMTGRKQGHMAGVEGEWGGGARAEGSL